jgi:hypothetical protein
MLILTKDQKKKLKKIAVKYLIKDKEYDERRNMKGLLNIFINDRDGWSGTDYYLFEGNSMKVIIKELEKHIDINGYTPSPSPYDCTGRYFSYPINVKILSENRVLISQNWAYDV